ncbi:MAG: HD domain-containing protein [Deltaproteobacteria bacterium]|nr:HD domain-containing protein [Deltaproteobacteria bacterium]
MTNEVQYVLKVWFENYINRYRNGDGVLCSPLELKLFHSQRVAENARTIARTLGLPKEEQSLAEGAGLVHDVGRFPQFVEFESFRDADTVDHGAYGRKVLEAENISRHLSDVDGAALLCAVEFHNHRTSDIPPGLSPKERRLLNVLRDADKLDVMDLVLRSVAADGFRELPTMLPQISLNRCISPSVLKEAMETKTVSSGNLATLGDYLVMLAVWFYDLNFAPTRRLAFQRDLLNRIQRELPDQQVLKPLFDDIESLSPAAYEIYQRIKT